jgi:hypothetical protein
MFKGNQLYSTHICLLVSGLISDVFDAGPDLVPRMPEDTQCRVDACVRILDLRHAGHYRRYASHPAWERALPCRCVVYVLWLDEMLRGAHVAQSK